MTREGRWVKNVLLAPNGMLAVFDQYGHQMEWLQGVWSEERRMRLWQEGYHGPIETARGNIEYNEWRPEFKGMDLQ